MKCGLWMLFVMVAGLVFASGCSKPPEPANKPDDDGAPAGAERPQKKAHTHEGDDALIWQRADLEHEGYIISLGHHGKKLYADHKAEPAVMITKDAEPVADAKVFVTLLDEAGQDVLVEEQATVYEPTTKEEPAHYAQASVKLPGGAAKVTLRYRIELPNAKEFSQNVVIPVSKH